MMMSEFVKIANLEATGAKITSEDYAKIETVYTYHPYFAEKGKDAIAIAYNLGGIGLIEALLPVARMAAGHYESIEAARHELNSATAALKAFDAETERINRERAEQRKAIYSQVRDAEDVTIFNTEHAKAYADAETAKFKVWANHFNTDKLERRIAKNAQ